MSYGFATNNKTAIMRGPMASNLVTQLVGQTKWSDLDYLVIDFPPGTGDIQLTLG
jgi:ATP-binding protein involved in chromosome partitioning